MKKKLMIILPVILVMIVGIGIGIFLYQKIENKKIVSTITLDINPSIEINLNKKEKVISVNSLNEDAKEIITEDYTNYTIEESLKKITEQVIKKGYTLDGKVTILVSTTGNITSETIENTLEKSFKEQNIETTIIKEDISTTAKENAEKYNISEGKASYIEEILKENEGLTFEELKDKSISELNSIKTEEKKEDTTPEEPKEEEKTETKTETKTNTETSTKSNTNSSSGNNNSKNSNTSNPPSDPKDKSGAWCTWNRNRPAGSTYYYTADIGSLKVEKIALEYLGLNESQLKGGESKPYEDKRSSYCYSYEVMFYDNDYKYYVYVDSVTGEVIDSKKEEMEKPNITEEQAIKIGLDYYHLEESKCDFVQAYFDMDMGAIRYTFNARCEKTTYTMVIDAKTGAISSARTW